MKRIALEFNDFQESLLRNVCRKWNLSVSEALKCAFLIVYFEGFCKFFPGNSLDLTEITAKKHHHELRLPGNSLYLWDDFFTTFQGIPWISATFTVTFGLAKLTNVKNIDKFRSFERNGKWIESDDF